ncbi:MAG: tetratricopeptide repeat protein [Spirochaetales bacterium]|nr:tetratricopeptide repeat protein [Spirochaetales bacterium]
MSLRSAPVTAIALSLVLAAALPGVAAAQAASAPSLAARANELMFAGAWYEAVETWLAALDANPAYFEAMRGLASCYLELGEYAQSLDYVERARPFRSSDEALRKIEGFALIGLGRLDEARSAFAETLAELPNDLEARFGLALLDLRAGRPAEARGRFEAALRIEPRNARALLSLALVALESGALREARTRVDEALRYHAEEARAWFVAARVALAEGNAPKAAGLAETALELDPAYAEARGLLASIRHRTGDYAGAAALMEAAVRADRDDALAWYALGRARAASGDTARAISAYQAAIRVRPDDEIVRLAAEDLVMESTALEDPSRSPWADWRFARATSFQSLREYERAIAEFRRGLRIYPYAAAGRKAYAELLRLRGLNGSYLAELEFLEELGKADRDSRDKAESWRSLLADSVAFRWRVDQFALPKRPYSLVVAIDPSTASTLHPEAEVVAASYFRSVFSASGLVRVETRIVREAGFADAWRAARELDADYLAVVSFRETLRECALTVSVHSARTGSLSATYRSVRSGNDRVQRVAERVALRVLEELEPRGSLLARERDRILFDLGSRDGVSVGDEFVVYRKGDVALPASGLVLARPPSGPLATITVTAVDEEISEGTLKSSGWFDRVNVGDTVLRVVKPGAEDAASAAPAAEPVYTGLFDEVSGLR